MVSRSPSARIASIEIERRRYRHVIIGIGDVGQEWRQIRIPLVDEQADVVGVGAAQGRVEAVDRSGLGDVERLALRRALGDVEEDDVAELLERGQVGEGSPDLSCADQRDLRSSHLALSPVALKPALG